MADPRGGLDPEAYIAVLERANTAQAELGRAACSSNGTFNQATFNQMYRTEVNPGEAVSEDKRTLIMCLTGVANVREFMKWEREFKTENPRYDSTSAQYAPGGRRPPREAPKKALVKALAKNTLEVRGTTATSVKKLQMATLEVVTDGLRRADGRCRAAEAIKFTQGNLINYQSPNKKVKKSTFNGSRDTRKRGDSP